MTPQTEEELFHRASQLAGLTLGTLAKTAKLTLPSNLTYGKGLIGQLLEYYLEPTAGTKSAPDFEHLRIELKTIPVTQSGKPCETTYICRVPLFNKGDALLSWRESKVYQKLAQVLWIPVESEPAIPILERRIGMPFLWKMGAEDENLIRQDWEEHMEKISLGQVESIRAHEGQYLQIRPKAANSKARTQGIGTSGESIATLPRGFYLRTQFTTRILGDYYTLVF